MKFFYNPIVIAEVYAGAFESEKGVISRFFDRLTHVELCKYTGILTEHYANQYRKPHHKISLEDYLIASCAQINS